MVSILEALSSTKWLISTHLGLQVLPELHRHGKIAMLLY